MGERLADLGDATAALVTFTAPPNLRGYRGRLGLPYAVLTDEDRATYRAYGLRRGPVWRVWGPATWLAYAGHLRAGRLPGRPTEDTLQLGGDFVVGPDGRLVYAFRSTGPDDRPPVEALVAAVRASRS